MGVLEFDGLLFGDFSGSHSTGYSILRSFVEITKSVF